MADDSEILDAALAQFQERGIQRTTTDDIARAAGINRVTLFRRLGSKPDIVRSAISHSTAATLEEIRRRTSAIDGYAERLTEGFAVTVELLRNHPLLDMSLRLSQEQVLAAITVDAAPVLEMASAYVHQLLIEAQQEYDVAPRPGDDVRSAVLARLIHSMVLVPDAPPALRTHDQLRDFAEQYLTAMFDLEPTTRP